MLRWHRLLLLGVVALALINLWRMAADSVTQARQLAPDAVARHEQRLAPVITELRARGIQGTIGYLTDVPGDKIFSEFATVEQYYLTQFAVAPIVLDLHPEHQPWVLVNQRQPANAVSTLAGFAVIKEFGDGLALLQRTAP